MQEIGGDMPAVIAARFLSGKERGRAFRLPRHGRHRLQPGSRCGIMKPRSSIAPPRHLLVVHDMFFQYPNQEAFSIHNGNIR
jgi:hypothetical protein